MSSEVNLIINYLQVLFYDNGHRCKEVHGCKPSLT
jgi:hypothetical protein